VSFMSIYSRCELKSQRRLIHLAKVRIKKNHQNPECIDLGHSMKSL
jgi:hypothetical protein